MNDRVRRLMAWAPLVGVAALAIRAVMVWDRLPARMMSHFDAHGTPNGWMSKSEFFVVSFAVLAPVFTLLPVMTERVARRKRATGWALLALNWMIAAVILSVFWGAIDANLAQTRLNPLPVWIFVAALIPLALAISVDWRWWLSRRREAAFLEQHGPVQVVAEERHGSAAMAAFMLAIIAVVLGIAFSAAPKGAGSLPMLIPAGVGLVLIAAVYWAWRGFVYRFTSAGVEIRALGLKLRRIPLSEIKGFSAERVNPLIDFGGWGIKGFGSDTAYIWGGHTALHIKTYTGDVYLGHEDPDRLVRDLEALMKTAR